MPVWGGGCCSLDEWMSGSRPRFWPQCRPLSKTWSTRTPGQVGLTQKSAQSGRASGRSGVAARDGAASSTLLLAHSPGEERGVCVEPLGEPARAPQHPEGRSRPPRMLPREGTQAVREGLGAQDGLKLEPPTPTPQHCLLQPPRRGPQPAGPGAPSPGLPGAQASQASIPRVSDISPLPSCCWLGPG